MKVGDHLLAPAWTNFRQTVLYESFDVTTLIKPGLNALGVLLGNGFYNVVGGRYAKYTGSFGVPRLWLQLHFEYDDGTSTDIGTDSAWRVHPGPITFSDIYGGEDFDARLEPEGWDSPGFDDSAWEKAASVEPPGGTLRADSSPPARVLETFDAIRITQPKPGVFIYDLGQNFAGWPRITVSGRAGASIKLTPGELLDDIGTVSQRSSGGPTFFTYTLRAFATETWSPRFSYYGFRYVQVEGPAPQSNPILNVPVIHSLKGEFVYLDDASHLKSNFGDRITFWGGGIDTQQVLPFGTPEQVRREVLERCRVFSQNGGYVFNTIHNVQAGTPVKNIVAMLDAVREFNGSRAAV